MATRTLEIVVSQTGNAKAGIDSLASSTDNLKKSSAGAGKGIEDLAGAFGLSVSPAALATAGIAAVGAAVVTSVNAAREGRAVQAQLATVLESTGHAAGISQAALNQHAEALQDVTNFDDEAVGSGQALLLTFTKIGGDTIPRATKAVLDMSTAMGQDLKSSSVQIGKALNDPIKGITALTRVGVTFSDEQKNMIKSMVQMGDVAGAQAVILAELEKEFGGSAEAARVADGGFIALSNSAGNLMEAAGDLVLGINEGTGAVSSLIEMVDSLTATVTEAGEAIRSGPVGALEALGAIANPLTPIMAALGMDIFPSVTAASTEAAAAINTQAEAHANAAGAATEQAEASEQLTLSQMETLTSLAQAEEAFNAKKEELLNSRLTAESDAAESQADTYRTMNEKLNEIDLNRGKQTDEQIAAKKAKIIQNYTEENAEIQARLNERQAAIDEQLRKEEEAYKAKAEELKLIMAAQVLEQSGQLEEMTGIAGITAEQYVQAVKFGAIEANKEAEVAMREIVQGFEGASRDQESIAKANAESIKRILGESATSSASGWKRATDSIVSDFERQATAAYRAAQASGATVNYSSNRGRGFASGGAFKVPPGYPNDTFPMRVSSGEMVTVIPANQAGAGPGFAAGTSGIPKGWKLDETGLGYVPPDYVPGSTWNGSKWVAPKKQFTPTMTPGSKTSTFQGSYKEWLQKTGQLSSSASSYKAPSRASLPAATSSSSASLSGMTITIPIDYHPTVALGTQAELERALEPAIRQLLRKFGVQISG